MVLLYPGGHEADVTFLGPASAIAGKEITMSQVDTAIELWLGAGQERSRRWLTPDEEASGGVAIDITAQASAQDAVRQSQEMLQMVGIGRKKRASKTEQA